MAEKLVLWTHPAGLNYIEIVRDEKVWTLENRAHTNLDEYVETAVKYCAKNGVENIDIVGTNRDYSQGVKEKLLKFNLLNYSNNKLNIEVK